MKYSIILVLVVGGLLYFNESLKPKDITTPLFQENIVEEQPVSDSILVNYDTPVVEEMTESTDEDKSKTIIVRGLGSTDDGDLEYAAEVLRDFFGYKVLFAQSAYIDESMVNSLGGLNSISVCTILASDVKTLYITDRMLYDHNDVRLRGFCSGDEKTVVVRGDKSFMRETIIHEVGHTYGLDHCDDLTCVMAIHNDEYDSGDFCNKCKKHIN